MWKTGVSPGCCIGIRPFAGTNIIQISSFPIAHAEIVCTIGDESSFCDDMEKCANCLLPISNLGKTTLSSTQSRKIREFEAREKLFIKIAVHLFDKNGEAALTMDSLIAHCEYSKGTVYKHFGSKQDLLAAIYLEKFKVLHRLFSKVVALPLSSRERQLGLHAAHSLFDSRYFNESARLMDINTSRMQEKMSSRYKIELEGLQQNFQKLLLDLIQEGIDAGDLRLPSGVTADMLAFANQGLSFGILAMTYGQCTEPDDEEWAPFLHMHLATAARLLDGYNWRPYSDAGDLTTIIVKVKDALKMDFAVLLAAKGDAYELDKRL